ncbi:MAG: IS6 family transposase, partial [Hyphomonadaceae bacterium]|nr:IS6 family transposase [Hyphomonadaceae bacterium]
MVWTIGGERVWIWLAVDDEGEVMDMIVQKRRDTGAALRLLRRLLRNQHVEPESIATDGLKSYASALREVGLDHRHRQGHLRDNNRAENSHLAIRRRERKMLNFKSQKRGAALSRNARRHLQRVQHSTAHDQQADLARLPRTLGLRLEQGSGVIAAD